MSHVYKIRPSLDALASDFLFFIFYIIIISTSETNYKRQQLHETEK
jgi:hypothetical protein